MTVRELLDRLALAALAATTATTVLGFFPAFSWPGELCSHFRWQYLLATLLLGLYGLWSRWRGLLAVVIAVALANGAAVWPALGAPTPAPVAGPAGATLSVVALNLEWTNRSFDDVRRYLAERHPDVIVLTEITPEWVAALADVTRNYPHWLVQPRNSAWGLGVYSRYPLTGGRFLDLGKPESVNVHARLDVPGHPVDLWAVHLASPTRPDRARTRNEQLLALAGALGAGPPAAGAPPRLVVGDLNVTPFSPYLLGFLQRTGLADTRLRPPWAGTWPAWLPPLRIQIDHLLADPPLRVQGLRRGPLLGSDHLPLEADIEIVG